MSNYPLFELIFSTFQCVMNAFVCIIFGYMYISLSNTEIREFACFMCLQFILCWLPPLLIKTFVHAYYFRRMEKKKGRRVRKKRARKKTRKRRKKARKARVMMMWVPCSYHFNAIQNLLLCRPGWCWYPITNALYSLRAPCVCIKFTCYDFANFDSVLPASIF